MENKATDFVKNEILQTEKIWFVIRILASALSYAGITFWLNAIRATAPLWFVWVLIIIQFALYFSIFIISYRRATLCGLNKYLGIVVFVTLAVLGRVENWELLIIPLTIAVMLIVSTKTKNISDKRKALMY